MLPPDLMAQLQGGGGGAPAGPGGPGGGGIPPELLAALQGGDQGGDQAPLPGVKDGSHGGGEDALTRAIDALQEAIDAEADQADIQIMLQCQTKLQGVLANNQKDADSMMGGKMTPGATRKAAGQAGY
jgi:hypothetical protein